MNHRPTDIVDLHLAPLALRLDSNLERLSGMSPSELDLEIALATNGEPQGFEKRQKALLNTVTHLVDLHGWTASWHSRGLNLAHHEHSLVLGVPDNLRSYLQP